MAGRGSSRANSGQTTNVVLTLFSLQQWNTHILLWIGILDPRFRRFWNTGNAHLVGTCTHTCSFPRSELASQKHALAHKWIQSHLHTSYFLNPSKESSTCKRGHIFSCFVVQVNATSSAQQQKKHTCKGDPKEKRWVKIFASSYATGSVQGIFLP